MKKRWLLMAAVVLLLAVLGWRRWQGPQVDIYTVQMQPLVQTVVATGRVSNVARVQVGSEIGGVVLQRHVQEGDRVAAGDLLATLRADDLQAQLQQAQAALASLQQSGRPQAQAALRQAEAQLAQAQRETARRKALLQDQLIARETYEQAVQAETVARAAAEQARLSANALASGNPDEVRARQQVAAAQAALARTQIRAVVDGVVLARNAEPGATVQPGSVLFEIANDGPTELRVPVDEKNLQVLAVGQHAQCVADAYPDAPFAAQVSLIAPAVDAQRGSVEVRLRIDPVPAYLRQDMTVSVNIQTGRSDQALVLPNDALSADGTGKHSAWVVRDGRARQVAIALGLRGTTQSQVVSGLKAGDSVLADIPDGLQDGQRVRVHVVDRPAGGAGSAPGRNELPVALD